MYRCVLVVALFVASSAAAATIEALDGSKLNSDGSPAEWRIKVKSGTPKVVKMSDGNTTAICLDSVDSSFSLQRDMDLDINKYPFVTFRWRADVLPPKGDLRNSSTDDQAAQMVVAFGGRYAIDYIWDTNAPIGTEGEFSVPLVVTAKILVVANKTNKLKEWMEVTRNLKDDFRRLFGKDPGDISGLRFQVNSQHTSSRAEGCISRITFHD
ncbi:MAG: DUF3047 domain-containing protein [Nitrospirota bacterium]|nr:DUF3047 domain-containing protein [Nitrospirota bacterium]